MPSNELMDIMHAQFLENMMHESRLMSDKDARTLKSQLQFVHTENRTFVVALALCKEMSRNGLQKIRCEWGSPLGGYVYDNVNDCYYVRCIDYRPLGYIPLACLLRMKDNNFWQIHIPLPETLLVRSLDNDARNKLKAFKTTYKDHIFQYMQLVE